MDIRRVPQNMLQMVNWQKKREPGTTDITREWLTGRLDGLLYGGQKTSWGAAYKPLLIVDNFWEARKNRHNENMLHRRKNGWEQGPKTEKTTKAALTFRRHSCPAVSGRAEETEQRPSNEKNKAFWAVPLHSITFLLRQVSCIKDTKTIQDTTPIRQCCSMFSENLFSWALPWSHLKLWAIEVCGSTSCREKDISGNACWENHIIIFYIQQRYQDHPVGRKIDWE